MFSHDLCIAAGRSDRYDRIDRQPPNLYSSLLRNNEIRLRPRFLSDIAIQDSTPPALASRERRAPRLRYLAAMTHEKGALAGPLFNTVSRNPDMR